MTIQKARTPLRAGGPAESEEVSPGFSLADALAARIRDLRVARDWSQERLAEEAGLSKDAVSRIERGDRNPRLATLEQIGAAVGLSPSKLVDFGEPLPPSEPRHPRARAIQHLLDSLDPRSAGVVISVIRELIRVGRKRST